MTDPRRVRAGSGSSMRSSAVTDSLSLRATLGRLLAHRRHPRTEGRRPARPAATASDTLSKPIMQIAGAHALTSPIETFARTGDEGPRNDLARLHRARLVVARSGRRPAPRRGHSQARLTAASHRRPIPLRRALRVPPGFKIWLVTNHRPRVEGDDDAIWRRLLLVPFTVNFIGREDTTLDAQLEPNSGILTWAVRGCIDWQGGGLAPPAAVTQATYEYRADEDQLGAFLTEHCNPQGEVTTGALRAAYRQHCDTTGDKPLPASTLGRRLKRRGSTLPHHPPRPAHLQATEPQTMKPPEPGSDPNTVTPRIRAQQGELAISPSSPD